MLLAELGLPLWPVQASEFAVQSDQLFIYILAVTSASGIAVYGALAYFCFRYANKGDGRRTPRILGSHKLELLWSIIPLMFFLSFFAWSVVLFADATRPPEGAREIFVVGKQWMWKIQHNDGVREINELHLKIGEPVKLTLTSEDVIHDFGVPAFRHKIDVMPGRYVSTWYKPTKAGIYHIFCDQYCGQGHSQMVGRVHVLTESEYADWSEGHKTDAPGTPGDRPTDGTPAWRGQALFLKLNCITCHNNVYDTAAANTSNRAPNLEGLYGSVVPIQGGKTVVADQAYIHESIRYPMAKVHDGWKPIMPAFPKSQVTDEELADVTAYIRYLRLGKLPKRTDGSVAPVGAPVGTAKSLGDSSPIVNPTPAPAPAPAPATPPTTTPKGDKSP